MSPAEYVLASTTAIAGPLTTWPMSLHRSGGVIGADCEYSSPVSTASSRLLRHGSSSTAFGVAEAIVLVSAVARNEKRTGSIGLGPNSWSTRSAAAISPPGLDPGAPTHPGAPPS